MIKPHYYTVMRIPSYKKIEKQAERYSRENVQDMSREWHDTYKTLSDEKNRLDMIWDKIRERCPAQHTSGAECICQSFPEYKPLVIDQLQPLIKKTNEMYYEKAERSKSLYLKELALLQRMREAKIKYCKTH